MSFEIKNGVLIKYIEEPDKTKVVIPDGVTTIKEYAFDRCEDLSVSIPDSVKVIEGCAFSECENLSIVIPDSVTKIETAAFSWCENLSVFLSDSVTGIEAEAFFGSVLNLYMNDLIKYMTLGISASEDRVGRHKLFIHGKQVTDAVIPSGVMKIEDGAFSGCCGLKSVTIPAGVTEIGYAAFERCDSLTSVVIPERVTEIRDSAFSGCSGLKSITIPDSVMYIGEDAFEDCSSLTEVILPDGLTEIGDNAFWGCGGLKSITIPDSVTHIGKNAFAHCGGLTGIAIPDSVTYIGEDAFADCDHLTDVHISLEKLAELGNEVLLSRYEIPSEETKLRAYCTALSRCPRAVKINAECALRGSQLYAAAEYFEAHGEFEDYAACHDPEADDESLGFCVWDWGLDDPTGENFANKLRDEMVSGFGLSRSGTVEWIVGGKTYTAKLQPDLTFTLQDEDGRRQENLPEGNEEAQAEFSRLARDIPAAIRVRTAQLFAEFLRKIRYTAQRWKDTYSVNPLLIALARLIVWQQDGTGITFTLDAQGYPIDAVGKPVELTDKTVFLAHPMELDEDTVKAWQDYFTEKQLKQPFVQMWEQVLAGDMIRPDRYEGCTIARRQLLGREPDGIALQDWDTLKLADGEAELELVEKHDRPQNDEVVIKNFRFYVFNRMINHIAVCFEHFTVCGHILKDDVSIRPCLDDFILPEILDFIDLAAQNGCANVAVMLQQYKQERFGDTPAADDFELEMPQSTELTEAQSMNALEAIRSRYSCRAFTGEPIPEDALETILQAGMSAPVASGAYDSLHLTVIRNKEFLDDIGNRVTEFVSVMLGKRLNKNFGAPVMVIVSSKASVMPGIEMANAGCVLENMAVAAASLGIGSIIWAGPTAVFKTEDALQKLGAPEGFRPVLAASFGYAAEQEAAKEHHISVNRV